VKRHEESNPGQVVGHTSDREGGCQEVKDNRRCGQRRSFNQRSKGEREEIPPSEGGPLRTAEMRKNIASFGSFDTIRVRSGKYRTEGGVKQAKEGGPRSSRGKRV